ARRRSGMRSQHRPIDRNIAPEQLRFLAAISPEYRDEFHRRELVAVQSLRDQEVIDFVRAITTPDWSQRDLTPPSAQTQQFVDKITRSGSPGTDRPVTEEDVRRFVDAITGRGNAPLNEGGWDATKHPRRGGPPNAGWWAPTTGGAQRLATHAPDSSRPQQPPRDSEGNNTSNQPPTSRSDHVGDATRPLIHRGPMHPDDPNHHPMTDLTYRPSIDDARIRLLGANSAAGHHWVPQAVYNELKRNLTAKALRIFQLGTEDPGIYYHAFDTWNGITHGQYNDAMQELLEDWARVNGGRLDEEGAKEFLSWIATGKCADKAFLAKHKKAFEKVFRWRKGFTQSVIVAKAALEKNPRLTAAELKGIAQMFVNGESSQLLSRRAAKVAQELIAGGRKGLIAIAKKVLPGLMVLTAATAAKRGWAGEGHTGEKLWGAANEVARDAMAADLIESLAFPTILHTVDGLVNLLVPALNDPTRYRFLWRNGQRIDMQTGRPVD
ncbi:MAG: hypothetical protein ABUL64_03945, partial [Singulisphaera sp.]